MSDFNYHGDWDKGGPKYDARGLPTGLTWEEINKLAGENADEALELNKISTSYFNPKSLNEFLVNLYAPNREPILDPSTYEPPNYRDKLNENSTEAELLEAIRVTKEACDVLDSASDQHIEIGKQARDQLTNLNHAVELIRGVREKADGNSRALRTTKADLSYELSWLQDLYTTVITRAKEMASLHEELEFFENLAKTRPWGSRAFPHQIDGAKQMAIEKRVILGDEMGLGKTLTAIMACDMSRAARVLVITPNDIVSNFSREVGKWASDRTMIPLGTIKDKFARHLALKSLDGQVGFVVLINYEMWRRDKEILKLLIGLKFDTVIIDEAHNMKDEKSQNFKGVREIVYAENLDYSCKECGATFKDWPWSDLCPGCYKPLSKRDFNSRCSVQRVYPMTGTAILNTPEDKFPLLHLLDRVAFPDKKSYLVRYCVQREVESLTGSLVKKWFFQYGGEARLIKKLGSKYIRRTLEDAGINLPPQDEQIHTLVFEEGEYAQQRKVIRSINQFNMVLLNELGDAADVPTLLAMLTRSRQAITYPAGIKFYEKQEQPNGKFKAVVVAVCDIQESIKVDYSFKLIKDLLDAEQKVVLFSQFKAPLKRLKELLNADGVSRVAIYDGDIPQDQLDKIAIQADSTFTNKADLKYDVLLVNYRKGGSGVNFTNYRQTILLDREWNYANEGQSKARTHRIGQTETTTVHRIEVENSIDDGMDMLINRKKDLVEGLNDAAERFSLIEYLKRKFNES